MLRIGPCTCEAPLCINGEVCLFAEDIFARRPYGGEAGRAPTSAWVRGWGGDG